MKNRVFRKYDIRGIFPSDLDEHLVLNLGRVLGGIAGNVVAVGRDCRPSGTTLCRWLTDGIITSGSDVIDLGVQTTPMTYFAAYTLNPDVTVMITGSHNPPEYNGFKILFGHETIWGEGIQKLRKLMEDISSVPPVASKATAISKSITKSYTNRLLSEFCFDRSLKIAIDAGNGTGGTIAIDVLKNLGCRVIPIYCEMDGTFPNHHPDPTVEENLQDLRKTVLREGADIGLAFDGDADRLGILDEEGNVVRGDRILIILAKSLLKVNPGATIISEVKASELFFSEIEKAGGRAVMSPTGHSLIKKAMAEENALLAGEMSGHIFFRDRYYGYDDALYAAMRLLEIIASDDAPLSSYLADLPEVFSTPEIREECSDESKFIVVDTVTDMLEKAGYSVDTTDGARVSFPDGWGLIRASNTQPVLVMRFEAGTSQQLAEYEYLLREYIEKAGRKLDVKTAD
ncbi:MAG: phosphomannomutase/phosphoglucomutase [Candidatus Aegiribacteria sp.]|nr:phosphomannomutase/phosphoglucomutase [Candidatus Aegiribacteria sp.]